uniref:Uncharacterized protein n=1 Tax=mine drainage metagenome TaxID=410659 RepID=E6PHT4_9ZZZZ
MKFESGLSQRRSEFQVLKCWGLRAVRGSIFFFVPSAFLAPPSNESSAMTVVAWLISGEWVL